MKQKAIFTLLLLATAALSFAQVDRSDTTKILFIGNSYTYFNSAPELLKGLAKEKLPNHVVETQLISQGGMTLERHWEEYRAVKAIHANDWDYVVLQEQSKLGMRVIIDDLTYFGQTDRFFEYARKFDAEIKKTDAKTVFFMTWSIEDRPKEQKILTQAYTNIAKELDAIITPVGLVWDKVRDNDQMDLYFVDGSHPSPSGSYLVATTMFATLFDKSPVGLSGKLMGNRLSSFGVPDSVPSQLVDIPAANAKTIQVASWVVAKAMKRKGGYPKIKKPKLSYKIPSPETGKSITTKDIVGKWYGTSTYSNDYNGLLLDIEAVGNRLTVNLSFYTPDRADRMTVTNVSIENNQLQLTIMDSLRSLSSNISFSFIKDQLKGVSKSSLRNVTRYKHWNLTRNNMQNGLDLEASDMLLQTFMSDSKKSGYIDAALTYYRDYSALIGKEYKPTEAYLNAMGNILLEGKKVTEGLNLFELATALYPQSVSAYQNYGVALSGAGQQEKGIKVYTEGYKLAKKTNHKNLSVIEANLKKLKANAAIQSMPPPPPPPPGGGQ
ncbi:DUF4886 domain-containing protein [Roseivirga sp.]|uniref:DUF4886 domain-containing protein n=1 Tax=Roseivirga sp. TaxID=1964215 RepID=UPI003B8E52B0